MRVLVVLPATLAVIPGQNQHGPVLESEREDLPHDPADLLVHVPDLCEVGVGEALGEAGRWLVTRVGIEEVQPEEEGVVAMGPQELDAAARDVFRRPLEPLDSRRLAREVSHLGGLERHVKGPEVAVVFEAAIEARMTSKYRGCDLGVSPNSARPQGLGQGRNRLR